VVAWIYDAGKGKKVKKQFYYFNNEEIYPAHQDKIDATLRVFNM